LIFITSPQHPNGRQAIKFTTSYILKTAKKNEWDDGGEKNVENTALD